MNIIVKDVGNLSAIWIILSGVNSSQDDLN
jgi:hypothetical protein